jgi:hypothetical protein
MKIQTLTHAAIIAGALALTAPAHAGQVVSSAKTTVAPAPVRNWFPDDPAGNFTLGGMFSDSLSGVYLDSITGLWASTPRDSFLFLSSRYHYEDNSQFISSTGLGFRQLLPNQEVILGFNVFYDGVNSENSNDYDQFGFGLEVLTHWVDARFNYYLPEDTRYEVSRRTTSNTVNSFGPGGVTSTTSRVTMKNFEAGLEGFNAEIGFLIPGLDRYAEVRAFAGYYHYDNPFGSDFDGFKARLEARVLKGVVANVEYWDDKALMGGHWTGGVAVTVPFSVYNLLTGRNPFEGGSESFERVPREFKSRMSDPIERSHRIQTTTSGFVNTRQSIRTRTSVLSPGQAAPVGLAGGVLGLPLE